jgi:hypothetical protein
MVPLPSHLSGESETAARVDTVARAVMKATAQSSGFRAAEHCSERGRRWEFTVPGVRVVVEQIEPSGPCGRYIDPWDSGHPLACCLPKGHDGPCAVPCNPDGLPLL